MTKPEYTLDGRPREVLLTGGIGDLIALSGWILPSVDISGFAWATRRMLDIQPLFEEAYPGIPHRNLVTDYTPPRPKAYIDRNHVEKVNHIDLDGIFDANLHYWAPQIANDDGTHFQWRPSPLLGDFIPMLSPMPDRYAVIVPDSPQNSTSYRQERWFGPKDWDGTLKLLERWDTVGIVLGVQEAQPAPRHPRLLDCQGAFTLAESIEITKNCHFYAGIDSCLSVVASKHLTEDTMRVKVVHDCVRWFTRFYWHPLEEGSWQQRIITGK